MNNQSNTADKSVEKSYSGVVLGGGMFLMGGIGLAYEYTFSKISSDLLGNSARQWAITIAVMMLFMGIGADLQKYFKSENLVDKLVISEILLGLLGAFGPLTLLLVFGFNSDYFVLFQYFFICSVGLLIGFEIPLITRINERYSKDLQHNLAKILKMDYVGSLCGALAWIFVLPRFFTIIESAFVLGLVNIAVAIITLVCFRAQVAYVWRLSAGILACSAGLVVALSSAEGWTVHAEQRLYRDRILLAETSTYQHLVLTRSQQSVVNCYLNGHIQFSSADEFIYHENLVHPAMAIAPRRANVLILGGGDGLAMRDVLRYVDVRAATLVDIDPMMTKLATVNPLFVALNEASLSEARVTSIESSAVTEDGAMALYAPYQKVGRWREDVKVADIQVMNIDAVKFVQQVPGTFDVIIIDFPDPNSLELASLYSQQFYEAVAKKLSADGIVALQSTSPYHAKEAFLCIGRTLKAAGISVVPYHDNVPSFGEWGWWIGGHDFVYGEERIKESLRGIEELEVDTRYISPQLIEASLIFGRDQLTASNDGVSTISSPKVFEYYLEGWQSAF